MTTHLPDTDPVRGMWRLGFSCVSLGVIHVPAKFECKKRGAHRGAMKILSFSVKVASQC